MGYRCRRYRRLQNLMRINLIRYSKCAELASFGKMISGAIELSNVDMTAELSGLIQAQQAFSGSSRLIQTETDMTRRLID